jgi:peptidoglycan L-alanyl-D-glutamate endopeptidase CwlK
MLRIRRICGVEVVAPMTQLTLRDRTRLVGVHPDLIRVIERARTYADFIVTEGLRTVKRQEQLVASGASKTMNSRHLTGHAVDLAALVAGQVRWDWPIYDELGKAVKRAAVEEQVPITWGGDWPRFRDGPHFELAWGRYP